ncbi:MAG: Zn-dependent exopeptidase M28 [Phycisphaerae bacterium]|nr:Zn-dependent exopeptidase M28 [Phycisphaerae bacterium]
MESRLKDRLGPMVAEMLERYDEPQTLDWVYALWQSDRESDYTAFARTARYAAGQLREIGVQDVEIVPCPADGRTRMQAWTMPLAWEADEATLRLVEPQRELICDRKSEPLSCCMWSEPTPPNGVRGPLAIVDDPKAVTPEQRRKLRGSFILTSLSGRGPMKVFAREVGALAVISSHVFHADRHPDALGWSNGWSDAADGWAQKASDCRMTGFQVTASTSQRLREMVAAGRVMLEAKVTGRLGKGTLPVVTGVLPGETDEEVLLVGHLYEIGVLDNASGCAAMIEAMRLMASMPRPRRRVRILLTSECYGTYAFYTIRGELLKRTVAGLNLDCVGEVETPERPAQYHRTSEASPAAVDTLVRWAMKLAESVEGTLPARELTHSLSDNAMCDPAAGVPTVCFMKAPYHWHTNMDDWSCLDPSAMRRATAAVAAAVRWLAEAGPEEGNALAEATVAAALADFPEAGDLSPERRAFFLDRWRARVLWTARLGAGEAEAVAARLPALDPASLVRPEDGGQEEHSTVPVRKFWGAPTFDNVPPKDRDGFDDPRWRMPYVTACYWADGVRSVAEIAALVRTEFDQPMGDLLRFFRVLERGGMVELRRK